jgi:hypothetical protein
MKSCFSMVWPVGMALLAVPACAQADGIDARVAGATEAAAKDNKRVLLQFASDAEHATLTRLAELDRALRRLLSYEYEHVPVVVGEGDDARALAVRHGVETGGEGMLALVVLDADGEKVAVRQRSGDGTWSGSAVVEFLEGAKATPLDAEDVLAAALERATREKKRVFVHLGAPW